MTAATAGTTGHDEGLVHLGVLYDSPPDLVAAVLPQLRRALDALPPEQLEVLTLAYLSGRSHEDISAHLGIPLGTVKGRVRLGLKKLRDHFADGQAVSPAA